jgi:hypothetical protein
MTERTVRSVVPKLDRGVIHAHVVVVRAISEALEKGITRASIRQCPDAA